MGIDTHGSGQGFLVGCQIKDLFQPVIIGQFETPIQFSRFT